MLYTEVSNICSFFKDSLLFLSMFDVLKEFNLITQLIIPFIFGGAVGALKQSYKEVKSNKSNESNNSKESKTKRVFSKHSIAGALAGIVAVNMFNPKGTIDQVIVISVFAGTHGMAWLLANSFLSSKTADEIQKELVQEDDEIFEQLLDTEVKTVIDAVQIEGQLDQIVEETIDVSSNEDKDIQEKNQ